MPFEGKFNTDRRYPVYLYDENMSGVAGVAVGSISVVYAHEDDSNFSSYSPNSGNWREFGGGKYTLQISGSVFNSSGLYFLTVSGSSFKDYNFDIEVRGQYLRDYLDKIYNVTPATTIATQTDINNLNDPTASEIASAVVTSGNAANWSGIADVSSLATSSELSVVESNLSGRIDTRAIAGDLMGLTQATIDEIVSSGNTEGWNVYSDATLANQTELLSRITNVSGQVDTLEAGQSTIQSQNSYIATQVSGIPDINSIVASGDAAGWGATAQAGTIISGIFDEVVNGSKTFRDATEEIWAYCIGQISASGTSPYKQSYYGMDDAQIFTLNVSGTGRSTT